VAVERVVSEFLSLSSAHILSPSARTRLLRRLEICGSHYHIPGRSKLGIFVFYPELGWPQSKQVEAYFHF
jgi:hypothetical protein